MPEEECPRPKRDGADTGSRRGLLGRRLAILAVACVLHDAQERATALAPVEGVERLPLAHPYLRQAALESSRDRSTSTPSPTGSSDGSFPSDVASAPLDPETLVARIFDRWVIAQRLAPGRERDRFLTEIVALSRCLPAPRGESPVAAGPCVPRQTVDRSLLHGILTRLIRRQRRLSATGR